ncbi:MAG: TRAM domain-containing protein [Gammaproteobacteria bacterium]
MQTVLVEKQSKMSSDHWAGRTDSNKWVIFGKGQTKLNEMRFKQTHRQLT